MIAREARISQARRARKGAAPVLMLLTTKTGIAVHVVRAGQTLVT
jgi:hypothetical protein